MAGIKDMLLDTGFKRDRLKAQYKLLWMACLLFFIVLSYLFFGDNGVIGFMIYAGVSYYPGKWLFLFIAKILKKEVYYSQEHLDQINKR